MVCAPLNKVKKSCRTKVPQIFQISDPNFASNFHRNFRGFVVLSLSFLVSGQKKAHKAHGLGPKGTNRATRPLSGQFLLFPVSVRCRGIRRDQPQKKARAGAPISNFRGLFVLSLSFLVFFLAFLVLFPCEDFLFF